MNPPFIHDHYRGIRRAAHEADYKYTRFGDLEILNTYDRQAIDGVFCDSDPNMTFRCGCPSELFRDGIY
jgi:hypothetical protein